MRKVVVAVKVPDGFRWGSWREDLERYDVMRCRNDDLTEEQIAKKAAEKYVGTPIHFQKVASIEEVDEPFFANWGDIA